VASQSIADEKRSTHGRSSLGRGKNLLPNGFGTAGKIDCEEAVAVGADDRVLVNLLSHNGIQQDTFSRGGQGIDSVLGLVACRSTTGCDFPRS